jgi:pyocin large subunit-like protein
VQTEEENNGGHAQNREIIVHRNKKEDDNIDEIKYSKKQRSSQAAYESTKAHLSNSDEDNHKGNIDIKKLSVATSNNNTSRATAATGNEFGFFSENGFGQQHYGCEHNGRCN